MNTTARKLERLQPAIEYGIIDSCHDRDFFVSTEIGTIQALRAMSCVVKPEPGDIVLISVDENSPCYILSILDRPHDAKKNTELAFDGDVNVSVRQGSLSLTSEDALSLSSRDFELNAENGVVRIDKTSFFGRFVENNIARLKTVAESVDSFIKRSVERVRSSYRYVEEHDEVQSASTRMIVDGTLTMHTKNTMHIAEGHVKIDAEQIHLG